VHLIFISHARIML